jgi:hypothetical protein
VGMDWRWEAEERSGQGYGNRVQVLEQPCLHLPPPTQGHPLHPTPRALPGVSPSRCLGSAHCLRGSQ